MIMRRPAPRPTGPTGERMILALLFIRAFYKQTVHDPVRLSDFHKCFRLYLDNLAMNGAIENHLGFVWNEAKGRFDDLDCIINVLEDSDYKILMTYLSGKEDVIEVSTRAGEAISLFLHHDADLMSADFQFRREEAERVVAVHKSNMTRLGCE